MKSRPGTYALILQSQTRLNTRIGRLGRLAIEPGYYAYVGSAFGPGGVLARVQRHCREGGKKHWHIDYLREFTRPVCAWYQYGHRDTEHRWAQSISAMRGINPVKGFGCSDCSCYAHLFFSVKKPVLTEFARLAGEKIKLWVHQPAE